MRATRIANRWNLKSRAKAGRYLLNWQSRLTQGARNLYIAGQQDALLAQANRSESDVLEAASKERHEQPSLSPPPPPENAHSNGLTQGIDRSISGGSLILPQYEYLEGCAVFDPTWDARKYDPVPGEHL